MVKFTTYSVYQVLGNHGPTRRSRMKPAIKPKARAIKKNWFNRTTNHSPWNQQFYKKPLIQGMSVVVPRKKRRTSSIINYFLKLRWEFSKNSTKEKLLAIAQRMIDNEEIDSLIFGFTELPLILTENKSGIPFLNTTQMIAATIFVCESHSSICDREKLHTFHEITNPKIKFCF